MRGATCKNQNCETCELISIHTPHAGSDQMQSLPLDAKINFNPHSPCGERLFTSLSVVSSSLFQSTLPMRGATHSERFIVFITSKFQSTLPMRGATLISLIFLMTQNLFQSTLPMRGATYKEVYIYDVFKFQSTLPMRGATDFAYKISFAS